MEKVKKFEFRTTDIEDKFILHDFVNDKDYDVFRSVDLMRDIQNMTAKARLEFIKFLKLEGISKSDLITETTDKDGKILVDESGYRDMEASYIQEYTTEKALKVYEKALKDIKVDELVIALNLTQQEAIMLGYQLRMLILNSQAEIPSKPSE